MPLNAGQQAQLTNELANASGSAIRKAISRLSTHWRAGSWLAPRSRYLKDADKQIRADTNQGMRLKYGPLSEYIAASAVVHCFDGWSYLGRALEAEMAADPDTARHLGYYAELRAAMSLLASEGIGVFSTHHVVVANRSRCHVLSTFGGTHQFVWHALETWARSSAGASAVLESISPNQVPLSDWLAQFSIGGKFLGTLLHEWGLDLSRLASDRSARNVASYRPTAFTSPGPRAIGDTMSGILRFWEVCEPGPNGGFPILDRHLLRRSLELGWHGPQASYAQQLKLALDGIAPVSPPTDWWYDFLSYKKLTHHHEIIVDASGTAPAGHPDHSKQVLARATLLLRVATGCLADLLRSAGSNANADLDFWLSSRSVSRRLWPESDPRSSSIDLWTDVEDALSSVEVWLESNSNTSPLSHHALWRDQPKEASTLATTERAFLWGAGL